MDGDQLEVVDEGGLVSWETLLPFLHCFLVDLRDAVNLESVNKSLDISSISEECCHHRPFFGELDCTAFWPQLFKSDGNGLLDAKSRGRTNLWLSRLPSVHVKELV